MSGERPVVLFSTGPLKETDNPYVHSLVAGLREHADVRFLTPWAALRLRPDVVHVHWPHQLAQGANRLRTLAKIVTSAVLLLRIARLRIPVVLTVHNLASHESGGRAEALLTRALDRLVSLRVYLNESPENDFSHGVVILHGSYRAWLREVAEGAEEQERGGAMLFGLLRPYKGIEGLIDAAADAGVPLLVAGRPVDDAYAARLHELAARAADVELIGHHHSDGELVRLIGRSSLVVLPYERMYNSGALLYALSAGRPVLAPRSPANQAIQTEVGEAWLMLYDGPLTSQVLGDAVSRADRAAERGAPALSRREWGSAIELHRRIYTTVAAAPWRRRVGDPAEEQRSNRALLVRDSAFPDHSSCNRVIRAGGSDRERG